MNFNNILYSSLCSVAFVSFLLSSCKKETEDLPYNLVEQFTVADNNGNNVKAVIGIDGTIMVYWPNFQHPPDSISPLITVSENATIQPASGTRVAFEENMKYTVTAQNGSVKNYLLKPMINNPDPVFYITDTVFMAFDKKMFIRGQYLIPDTNQTKLFLVDAGGVETPIGPFERIYSTTIETRLPQNIEEGQYSVKMVSGQNTIVKGPYRIRTYDNAFANQSTYSFSFNQPNQVLQNGQIISFNYTTSGTAIAQYFINLQRLTIYSTGNGYATGFDAERISLTENTVTYKIPAEVPPGNVILIIWAESGSGINGRAQFYVFNGNPGTSIAAP